MNVTKHVLTYTYIYSIGSWVAIVKKYHKLRNTPEYSLEGTREESSGEGLLMAVAGSSQDNEAINIEDIEVVISDGRRDSECNINRSDIASLVDRNETIETISGKIDRLDDTTSYIKDDITSQLESFKHLIASQASLDNTRLESVITERIRDLNLLSD